MLALILNTRGCFPTTVVEKQSIKTIVKGQQNLEDLQTYTTTERPEDTVTDKNYTNFTEEEMATGTEILGDGQGKQMNKGNAEYLELDDEEDIDLFFQEIFEEEQNKEFGRLQKGNKKSRNKKKRKKQKRRRRLRLKMERRSKRKKPKIKSKELDERRDKRHHGGRGGTGDRKGQAKMRSGEQEDRSRRQEDKRRSRSQAVYWEQEQYRRWRRRQEMASLLELPLAQEAVEQLWTKLLQQVLFCLGLFPHIIEYLVTLKVSAFYWQSCIDQKSRQ